MKIETEVPQQEVVATMVIKLHRDGSAKVAAPLNDKIICYAMHELARDLVKDYRPSPILAPQPGQRLVPG